ncbi:MAG: hypothetical protein ACFB2Z_09895 [Maricaulaceae bacterium]
MDDPSDPVNPSDPGPFTPLPLDAAVSASADAFVPGRSNAAARSGLARWRDWPQGGFVLVGPPGSGKSHLARAWAEDGGARVAPASDDTAWADAGADLRLPLVVDDADCLADELALFRLLNAATGTGGLLLTARRHPLDWTVTLPDLAARLRALDLATIEDPCDAVMAGLLEKLFRDRGWRVSDQVIDHLAKRIERSFPAARAAVEALHHAALSDNSGLTLKLAREWTKRNAPSEGAD